jgi:hypothetical protein
LGGDVLSPLHRDDEATVPLVLRLLHHPPLCEELKRFFAAIDGKVRAVADPCHPHRISLHDDSEDVGVDVVPSPPLQYSPRALESIKGIIETEDERDVMLDQTLSRILVHYRRFVPFEIQR